MASSSALHLKMKSVILSCQRIHVSQREGMSFFSDQKVGWMFAIPSVSAIDIKV